MDIQYKTTIGTNEEAQSLHVPTVIVNHPENPKRITEIINRLDQKGILKNLQIIKV